MRDLALRRRLRLLIVAATLLAFSPLAGNDFLLFDDPQVLTRNPVALEGLSPRTVLWALTSTENSNWYPLTRLGHLLDASLFGTWAGGHHLAQLGVHAAAAAVLFEALALMTGAAVPSAFVAAVFALHPLRVESVAWVTELSDVLAALCFALALLLHARAARSGRRRDRLLLLGAVALGCSAKPTMVVLPPILLVLDLWPLGRRGRGAWALVREKLPLFAVAGATALLTLKTQGSSGAVASLADYPPAVRAMNAALAATAYLGKLVWPLRLSPFYPHPGAAVPASAAALAGAALAAVTALAAARRRASPWLAAGWAWYLLALFPVSGLVQAGFQGMADRFTYLSLTGVVLALAWEARRRLGGSAAGRRALAAGAAAFLLFIGVLTPLQARRWRDTRTIFEHALELDPRNWLAAVKLGEVAREAGDPEAAIAHFRRAIELDPGSFYARTLLGVTLGETGRPQEALEPLAEAVRLRPGWVDGQHNLAVTLANLGRYEEAVRRLRAEARLRPASPRPLRMLALVLPRLGRLEEAAAAAEAWRRLEPANAEAAALLERLRAAREAPPR